MRVLLVCPYAWDRPGGVQTHVRALARELTRRSHDVLVTAPHAGKAPPAGGHGDVGVELVGRAVPIPANGSVAPLTFGPGAAMKLGRVVRGFAPDVAHLHEPLIPSLSLLALRVLEVPAVGTFHAATGSSAGYWVARPLLSRVVRRVAVRTAVSDTARALAARYFPGEYLIVPNAVETGRFAGAAPMDLDAGPNILFLGRVERRKGLETLIQAIARLRDLQPRLVVAGSGPRQRACRALARQLEINATWLGTLDEDELPRVYSAADVYCAPNLGGESFGLVLLEAMAAGTPVVCSDLPSFRSVAGDGALFAAPGKPGAFAAALRRVLSDGATSARLEKAGQEVAARFDWGRVVEDVEKTYELALARH